MIPTSLYGQTDTVQYEVSNENWPGLPKSTFIKELERPGGAAILGWVDVIKKLGAVIKKLGDDYKKTGGSLGRRAGRPVVVRIRTGASEAVPMGPKMTLKTVETFIKQAFSVFPCYFMPPTKNIFETLRH